MKISDTYYGAGFRDTEGSYGMFAGPTRDLFSLLDLNPLEHVRDGKDPNEARIIRFSREGPFVIFRWYKGIWEAGD